MAGCVRQSALRIRAARMFEGIQDLLARMAESPVSGRRLRELTKSRVLPRPLRYHSISRGAWCHEAAGPSGFHPDGLRSSSLTGPQSSASRRFGTRPAWAEGRAPLANAIRAREKTVVVKRSRLPVCIRRRRTSASGPWGRGRAIEIIRSDDFDGETAERYGYVNRALRTLSSMHCRQAPAENRTFDRRAIRSAKNLSNQSRYHPPTLLDQLAFFLTSVAAGSTAPIKAAVRAAGLNKPGDTGRIGTAS